MVAIHRLTAAIVHRNGMALWTTEPVNFTGVFHAHMPQGSPEKEANFAVKKRLSRKERGKNVHVQNGAFHSSISRILAVNFSIFLCERSPVYAIVHQFMPGTSRDILVDFTQTYSQDHIYIRSSVQ